MRKTLSLHSPSVNIPQSVPSANEVSVSNKRRLTNGLLLLVLFGILTIPLQSQSQALNFNFETGAAVSSPAGGWTNAGVGTYYRSSSASALTFSNLATACNGYTKYNASSGSVIFFQPAVDIVGISVSGTGTGTNRTFSSIATSSTIGGTYTNIAGASGSGTIGAGSSANCGTVSVTNTGTITAGTFVRITFSGNINTTRVEVTPATVTPPSTQASNISFTSVGATSMNINWTRGNGSNVAVFMKEGTGAISDPADGTSYSADNNWNVKGTQLGSSGYYCIYNGSATTTTVTNLSPSTTYTVQAFEYNDNGSASSSKYLTTTAANNPNSQATTVAAPTIIVVPSSLDFNGVKNGTVAEKTYNLSAEFLSPASGVITITAPAGYTVSTTGGSGYSSSITIPYSGSTLAATTIYVAFAPTAFITYSGTITHSGGSASANLAVTGDGVQYNVGDYGSVATGNWSTASTWKKWDGTGFNTTAGSAPTTTDNVVINAGHTVTVENSGTKNCKDLTVNGTLISQNLVNAPAYVRVYGSRLEVNTGGFIGSAANPTGDDADGICLDVYGPDLTITGSGGGIYFSRMRTNVANSTVTIDHDMTLNYHGSTNQGGHTAALYPQAGDGSEVVINTGRTLTFAPWAVLATTSSSNGMPALSFTVTVNGTLTLLNSPAPNAGTPGNNSFIYGGTASGKTFTLNIGSTGVVNVPELYPNGTMSGGGVATGSDAVISIAVGGVLNVSSIADFRKASQVVSGGGTFNLLADATLRIGSPGGITASAPNGPVQTAFRNYSTGGTYSYEGGAAQVTGDGLPATISGLVINNTGGVTLSNHVTITETLALTKGIVETNNKIFTLDKTAGYTGGSATSHINGPLVRLTNTTGTYTFPVGKNGIYRPFSVIPNASAESSFEGEYFNSGGPAVPACNASLLEAYIQNEYWDVQKNSGADAQVQLNYEQTSSNGQWTSNGSNSVADPASTKSIVVAHYTGTCWENAGGSLNASSASGTVSSNIMSSFSPFTFGYSQSATLPVHFTSIKARQTAAGIEVGFTNATEIGVLRYEIERSANGTSFSFLSSHAPHSNDGRSMGYLSLDRTPFKGSNYYRVKCMLADGKITYSPIARINTASEAATLALYPNPVKGETVSLQFSSLPKGVYVISVINTFGQQVYTESIQHNGGSAMQSLQLGRLQQGVYRLQLVGEGLQLQQPFLKF